MGEKTAAQLYEESIVENYHVLKNELAKLPDPHSINLESYVFEQFPNTIEGTKEFINKRRPAWEKDFPHDSDRIESIVDEATKNYVRYGYENSEVTYHQWLAEKDEKMFFMSFSGPGPGFDPLETWNEKNETANDPAKYLQQLSQDAHGVGLQMIVGLADQVLYMNQGRTLTVGIKLNE